MVGLGPPSSLVVSPSGGSNNMNSSISSPTGSNTSLGPSLRGGQSMTIDEMRHLHRRALQEAEAKRTELRLVLASRYRELVGSSDEVLRMKERAQELHDLVHALPDLLRKLQHVSNNSNKIDATKDETTALVTPTTTPESEMIRKSRQKFSELTRSVHRALDRNQVHLATTTLIRLFCLFASHTDEYPLANSLASKASDSLWDKDNAAKTPTLDISLKAQMRMIYYQVQALPPKIIKSSRNNLLQAASYDLLSYFDPSLGAERSAAALASLDLLSTPNNTNNYDEIRPDTDRAPFLLEIYFDSKAQLLGSLFNQLTVKAAGQAEEILSKIVLILQHDIIVHTYEIFVLRKFPGAAAAIMETLPFFDPTAVQARCSKFLASHLPLIRTKVKSVLVSIAGTTASALGQIRQSLYDKTDGIECHRALDSNPFCTWDEAVSGVIDVRHVLSHSEMTPDRKFSLWSALFSHTFSSLVHSLLTTSFHSVHSNVVSTLRASLSQAPSVEYLLPHEAYRNTLRIATVLDQALLKVSDDAHELLVHAEEREESELRLRQSLYVQTCEILGRLLCEVRRIVTEEVQHDDKDKGTSSDGTRELIVGRLCYFLKFRLTSLPTLLDPESSPAAAKARQATTTGMIFYKDVESAFSLADDNADGLISFAEAMEATDSAFSGTQFHGSEMLRGTLLLSDNSKASEAKDHLDVTLNELMLLTARGLRHGTGEQSALGIVQKALDDIVSTCFEKWADATLKPSELSLSQKLADFWKTAASIDDAEWQTLFHGSDGTAPPAISSSQPFNYIPGVSPETIGFVTNVSFILNRTVTPADSMTPVPSMEQAAALGISQSSTAVPSLTDTLRWTLLRRSLHSYVSCWINSLSSTSDDFVNRVNSTAILQFYVDVTFAKFCFTERNQFGFGVVKSTQDDMNVSIMELAVKAESLLKNRTGRNSNSASLETLKSNVSAKHRHVDEVCDLIMSSLFGARRSENAPAFSVGDDFNVGAVVSGYNNVTTTTTHPFCYTPLSSTRRFVLLPIQSDRTIADLQIKGAYRKEKEEQERQKESIGGSVMSSGLGFFSSMLKKK